jgi:hypothetical protein
MTYHYKSTGLASVAALAVGALLAFAPMKAEAASITLNPTPDILGNVIAYDIKDDSPGATSSVLDGGNDYVLGVDVNIQDAFETFFDFTVNGSGTLTINTYVDPFAPGGIGTAIVRLGNAAPPLVANAMFEVKWGTGPTVSLTSGTEQFLSTSFAGAGLAFSETLFFEWSNFENVRQVDVGIASAPISPVPLPASALLLLGGLGGLGGLSALRRRKRAA